MSPFYGGDSLYTIFSLYIFSMVPLDCAYQIKQNKAMKEIFSSTILTCLLMFVYLMVQFAGTTVAAGKQGRWQLLLNSTGVVAMHMALTHRNTVVMFDQTEAGRSGYALRRSHDGRRCLGTPRGSEDSSCWAHSVEYHIGNNSIKPLWLESDTWCSSGSFLSNGTLLQTGGHGRGYRRIRQLEPCSNMVCNWRELKSHLVENRWYSTNQVLPEKDRVIVVGGRGTFTYEFVPKLTANAGSYDLPFLQHTFNRRQAENNLYPFIHLSSDGHLFIFANRDSILFNYKRNRVVKNFPRMPGGGSRNYPGSGSSVILPLDHTYDYQKSEVMVCGGASSSAYQSARQGNFLEGLSSCGRLVITGNRNEWAMEEMPGPRLMHDMLLLPTGHILIINGARQGSAGWNNAHNPSLQPYLYKPKDRLHNRFSVLKSTKVARLYHSSAVLLPDGRVLVAGSNPNRRYTYDNVTYPTELRLQAFVPHYMGPYYHNTRPLNVSTHYTKNPYGVFYGEEFNIRFWIASKPSNEIEFTAYSPPFTTHSNSMNQRMLRLKCNSLKRENGGWMRAVIQAPSSSNVAPSGYYMLTVVNEGIPSTSQWIRIMHHAPWTM